MPTVAQFLDFFRDSFVKGQFLKCTLSKPSATAHEGLKNIFLRPVEIKGAAKVACTFRFKTRDEVKNYTFQEIEQHLQTWLGDQFLNADLFTTEKDATIVFKNKTNPLLLFKKPVQQTPADTRHNREKKRLLDPSASWLHWLGITSAKGEILAAAQDKWRQINKFLESMTPIVEALPKDAYIADMGSGKGYLTFALYDFLKNSHGMSPNITGIELRPALVEFCNKTAQQVGFEGLSFVAADINQFTPPRLDMLIALHACDTATDLAIAKGIHAGAKAIVVAPCCHKQIRRDMAPQNEMTPVLKFGILEERQAEILTDGIRALLLEANGYKTQVFEFISTEHTPKNVMITAVLPQRLADATKREKEALAKVEGLKTGFGIKQHYLEHLLKKEDINEISQ